MRLLRGLAGLLLWIVALVLGLVAVILCATLILLPLGLPLLGYARRLLALGIQLMLPRSVGHPVETVSRSLRKQRGKAEAEAK